MRSNCSELFVLDGKICRSKCPSDLFEHNKICVDICPNHTFVEDKKCVDICSSGFYEYKSYCVDTCPPDNFIDESNNLCVKNCNGSKYHLKKNIFCLDKCPENMAEVNLTCVNQCPQNRPFFHQGSCLADCPVSAKYVEKKRKPGNKPTYSCVNKCKKYTSSMSNVCVDACFSEQVLFQEVCQEQCPASVPYKVHLPANLQEELTFMSITNLKRPINAFVICEKACPSNFVRDNEDCYVECPIDNKSMIYNMTCFQHCPDEYPFVIKENSRSICTNSCKKLHFQQECLDKCPHSHSSIHRGECVQCNQIGMYEENHHCVNSCKVVQFEKRCYDTCPSAAKFVYNGSCVRTCPSNANKVDKRRYDKYTIFACIDSCPTDKYIFGNKCVSSCPNPNTAIYKNECVQCSKLGMYTDNQHCVNSCNVVQYENRCYNSCPQTNKFMYNGTCLHSCPSNAKKVDEQHHEPNNFFVCMETCPSEKYTFGNNCVSSCPDRKRLPVNGKCIACHEVGKYDDGSKCVDMCPNLHYEYRCVDYCPTYPTYFKIFNKTCVRNCPKSAPISSFIYNYITKRNDYRCLKNCPIGTYLKENKCVTWCETDYFILNKLCVKKCPVDALYISSDYVQNTYNKECSKFCKESDYLLNFTCMEKCPKGFFGHDKQCLQKCPIDFPYISQDNVCVKRCNTLRLGMNCFDKCPRKTFQYNQTCVQNCPFSKPYNFKGNCVDICSHFLMKKTCYKQCPSGLVGYQKKCHLQCPFKARYKYNWECIPQCPKNTLLGFIKYTCFDTCPQGEFKYLQKCVELCPKDAPYDFNGECVKYCAGYLDGFSCYKQCPDKMFAFTGKCIPKCPEEAPFVNIKNCVRTCPYVHDSQLNCMKDCPEQTYPHGKQCKAGCPPDRPFSGPFFDPKCVEKCDNYELATENNKCISRSSCSTFIYGMRCLSKCPSHTYLLYSKDEKICKSLISVYFMMCILSFVVVIAVAFVIRSVYHCCKMLGLSTFSYNMMCYTF